MRAALVFAFLNLFVSVAFARCDSGEQVIRLGLSQQSATPTRSTAVTSLTSSINRELQGRACLQVLSDDQLYAEALSVTALQSGAVEMALPSFSDLANVAKDYQVFDLPFAFRNDQAVQRFLTLSGGGLNEPLKKFGVKSLSVLQGHFEQISAKRPVFLPSDLAGLKVVSSGGANANRMIIALDGVQQSVAKGQLPVAVKDGRVDAQFSDWITLQANNTALLHEGVTQTNQFYRGHVLLVSQSWWDGLNGRLKRSLTELTERTIKQANFDSEQQYIIAKRNVMRAGAKVRGLTRFQRQVWLDRLKPIWDEFENRKLLEMVKQADRSL